MMERIRETETPLYIWIKQRKSINNIHDNAHLYYRPPGNQIVEEVLERMVRLYDVDVSQFNEVVNRLINRYRSKWSAMTNNIQYLAYSDRYQGPVRLERDKKYNWMLRYTADYSDAYMELKRFESCNSSVIERQLKLVAEAQRKPENKKVNVVAVRETVKVINRLSPSWAKHYYNIQTKPAKVPKALAEIDVIVEIPAVHPPGVYFLCQGNEVVYVGQSKTPSIRIAAHQVDKKFNRVFLIPTNDLDKVELEYIKKLRPKYNIVHNYG